MFFSLRSDQIELLAANAHSHVFIQSEEVELYRNSYTKRETLQKTKYGREMMRCQSVAWGACIHPYSTRVRSIWKENADINESLEASSYEPQAGKSNTSKH